MSLARIIEVTIPLAAIPALGSSSTSSIDLNGADKFSVEIVSVLGLVEAFLEGSNNGVNWTVVDTIEVPDGVSRILMQSNSSYRYARVRLTNDDITDADANCLFLVIGDAG